jgi:hypothetical protein
MYRDLGYEYLQSQLPFDFHLAPCDEVDPPLTFIACLINTKRSAPPLSSGR